MLKIMDMSGQELKITTPAQLNFYIRGQVLDHFIMLENLINLIIANKFSNDESTINDAVTIVFDLNLPSKIKILENILSKIENLPFSYLDIIKDINKKNLIRNDFAHCITHIPEEPSVNIDFEIKLTKVNRLNENDSHRIIRTYKKSEHMTIIGEMLETSQKLMFVINKQKEL